MQGVISRSPWERRIQERAKTEKSAALLGKSCSVEIQASGQQLFINSLLPANGAVSINSLTNVISSVAEGEPCRYRLTIEDTDNPTNIRFLHVLQGADAGKAADATTNLQSTSGDAFAGVSVRGVAVLFPVNVLSNNFTGVSYTAPAGVTNHYLAGLLPNMSYAATVQTNAGQIKVTVAPGSGVTADNAGLLRFDNSGEALNDVTPQSLSAQRASEGIQLTGLGGPLLPYQVLAGTNLAAPKWAAVGTATADASGVFQFLQPLATNSAQRYYRLTR